MYTLYQYAVAFVSLSGAYFSAILGGSTGSDYFKLRKHTCIFLVNYTYAVKDYIYRFKIIFNFERYYRRRNLKLFEKKLKR